MVETGQGKNTLMGLSSELLRSICELRQTIKEGLLGISEQHPDSGAIKPQCKNPLDNVMTDIQDTLQVLQDIKVFCTTEILSKIRKEVL